MSKNNALYFKGVKSPPKKGLRRPAHFLLHEGSRWKLVALCCFVLGLATGQLHALLWLGCKWADQLSRSGR